MNVHGRERKVDISKMSIEQVDNLSLQVGQKVQQICDEAAAKVNEILNIYGMSAKMAIQFDKLGDNKKQEPKSPKKRGRKPKQANL